MSAKRLLDFRSGSMQRQLTESDCAVWAIKAICFQVGVSVPPANLVRKHIEIDKSGTSIRDVRDALQEFGVSAQPVQGPVDAVAKAPLPAIALVRLEEHVFHYVVVLNANHRTVRYLDPNTGGRAKTISAEKFAAQFTGCLVLCDRRPDYASIDFTQEVKPSRFLVNAVSNESNSIIALAVGEVFQLLMLLIGILMLKNFFGSSMFGMPNFWFLAGIAICTLIYVWIGKLQLLIKADIKTRCSISLFSFASRLIRKHDFDPKKGMRESAARCLASTTTVAHSLANVVSLPATTFSLFLFVVLVAWLDPWAGGYALGLVCLLPAIGVWTLRHNRFAQQSVSRLKERNEVGLVYLMAKSEPDHEIVEDIPWNQLELCDAITKQDDVLATDAMIVSAASRLSVFVALLIGGLQNQELGMGHMVAVFFLLSLFSSVVSRWARQIALLPESKFQVRSLLDLLSDFTPDPLSFSTIQDSGKRSESDECTSSKSRHNVEFGGAL